MVNINSRVGESFKHKRGLRQGDLLSPYLFLLATDVMTRMVTSASSSIPHNISTRLCSPYFLLQYADDTLIFSTTKGRAVLGIHINPSKTTFVLFNCNSSSVSCLAQSLNCTPSALPLNYLGLPLTATQPDRAAFQALINKRDRRRVGWKSNLLSRAGHIVLTSTMLSAIPIFFMSIFRLPVWVRKEIDKIRKNFIWSGTTNGTKKLHLLSWQRVCLPKRVGGFGLTDLHVQNISLLLR